MPQVGTIEELKEVDHWIKPMDVLLDNETIRAVDGDTSFLFYTVREKPRGEGAPPIFNDEDGDDQTHLSNYQQLWKTAEGADRSIVECFTESDRDKYEVCAIAIMVRVQGLS